MSWKETVRKYCPEYLPLRRLFSRMKVWQSYKYSLSKRDVVFGEKDSDSKEQIVKKCVDKWPEKAKDLETEIELLFKNISIYNYKQESDLSDIDTDMKFCYFAYGFPPSEYMFYHFEHKINEERSSYISDLDIKRMAYRMNDVVDYDILNNKWNTYLKFSKYYSRKIISVTKETDYDAFDLFTMEHSTFIRKNTILSKGKDVELVNLPDVLKRRGITKQIYFNEMIRDGKYILEEKIEQGKNLAELHPSSVNTVRCLTFYTQEEIVVGFCFLRLGRGGSIVDNSSAGGIVVGIDKTTGNLNTDGFDKLGNIYSAHPDTGVKFNGFQLPEWNELMGLCRDASAALPSIKFIGWDFAYSSNGWVLVEGNAMPQITGPQIILQRGLKKDVEDIMTHMELMT